MMTYNVTRNNNPMLLAEQVHLRAFFFAACLALFSVLASGCATQSEVDQRFTTLEYEIEQQKNQGTRLAVVEDRVNTMQIQLDQLMDGLIAMNAPKDKKNRPRQETEPAKVSLPQPETVAHETPPARPEHTVPGPEFKRLAGTPGYEILPGGRIVPAPGEGASVPAQSSASSATGVQGSQQAHSGEPDTPENILDNLDRALTGGPELKTEVPKSLPTALNPEPWPDAWGGENTGLAPSSAAAATKPAPKEKPSYPAGPADQAYASALAAFERGHSNQAAELFSAFIAGNPGHKLMPNAMYWLGECYYDKKQYGNAILAFKDVTAQFPRHPKAAAAMLKTGFSYERMGDKDNARFYLQALLKTYPDSEPAKLARKKLAALR